MVMNSLAKELKKITESDMAKIALNNLILAAELKMCRDIDNCFNGMFKDAKPFFDTECQIVKVETVDA